MLRQSTIALALALLFAFSGCKRQPIPLLKETLDGTKSYWTTSSPEEQGFDRMKLENAVASANDLQNFYALLVIRDGQVVVERYFGGANSESLYHLRSITKNVTSALTGIAIDEGLLPNTDVKIHEYFPDLATGEKKAISIQHLLNMSSGLEWKESTEILPLVRNRVEDPIRYVLSKEMKLQPGEKMNYNSITTHVLGNILKQEFEKPLDQIAKEKLFTPMGIKNYRWEKDPEGLTWGGYGLQLRARDLAKLGQLYLQKGNWEGEQLVPEQWVVQSSIKQIETSTEGGGYSNQWWYTDREVYDAPMYYGLGYGGQGLLIAPAKNLVVVTMQNHFVPDDQATKQWNDMVEKVFQPIYESMSKSD